MTKLSISQWKGGIYQMKKTMSIVVFILVILFVNIQFASAAPLGIRENLLEKDYIVFHSNMTFVPDSSYNSINIGIGGKYTLSPSLIIGFGNSFSKSTLEYYISQPSFSPQKRTQTQTRPSLGVTYLFGDDFLLNIALGLNTYIIKIEDDFQTDTEANTMLNISLAAEYIFLNKPLYKVASFARLGTQYSSLELWGLYNISPILKLDGSTSISYNYYSDKYFSVGGIINLTYKEKPFQTILSLDTGLFFYLDSSYAIFDN